MAKSFFDSVGQDSAKSESFFDSVRVETPPARAAAPADVTRQTVGAPPFDQDVQRVATGLERTLDALNTAEYVGAGLETRAPGEGLLGAAGRGIRERRTYGQNMIEQGVNPKDAALRGLTKAIALDPLSYVGLGMLTKGGRAARSARIGLESAELSGDAARVAREVERVQEVGRLGRNLGEQAKLGQRSLVSVAGKPVIKGEAVYSAVDKVWEALGRKPLGQVEGEALGHQMRQIRAAEQIARNEAMERLQPVASNIDAIAAKHKIDRKALDRVLTTAVERAKDKSTGFISPASIRRGVEDALSANAIPVAARQELGPHVFRMVKETNRLNEKWLGEMMGQGIDIAPLQDPLINYMPRIKTPEGARAVREAQRRLGGQGGGAPGLEVITERTPSQRERSFKGWTTADINDEAVAGKLGVTGRQPVPEGLFIENPMAATVAHAGQAARSARSAQLLKGYASKYGGMLPNLDEVALAGYPAGTRERIIDEARKQYEAAGMGRVTTTIKGLEEFYLPKDLVEPFQRHMAAQADPAKFAQLVRDFNRTWARYTVSFPVTQIRNQVGDLWNGWLLSGANIDRLDDALELMSGYKKNIKLGGKTYTRDELIALANQHGLLQSTRTEQFAPASSTLRLRPKNKGEAFSRAVNENVYQRNFWKMAERRDFANRFGVFLDGLDKGMGPEASTIRVMDHFFDYATLKPGESKVRDYVAPFFAWTRFNVPFQAQQLAQRPGIAGGLTQKGREAMAIYAGDEEANLGFESGVPTPRFMEQGLPVRLPPNAEGDPQFLRLEATHPLADVAAIMDPKVAVSRGMGLLSPAIKTPVELATGVSLFGSDFGEGDVKMLERFPGETTNFLGLPLSKRWAMPIATNIRALGELNRANPGNVFGTQTEPGWAGYVRTSPDVDPAMRAASMLLGRPYAFDEEREIGYYVRRKQKEMADAKAAYLRAAERGDKANMEAAMNNINEVQAELVRVGATVSRYAAKKGAPR